MFGMLDASECTSGPLYRTPSGLVELYQADCVAWLCSQPEKSFEAVVTDPPYGLVEYTPLQVRKLRAGRGGVWRIPPALGGYRRSPLPRFTVLRQQDYADMEMFFRRWGTALYPKLVPGAHVFIASNPLLSHVVSSAVVSCGFEKRGEIVRLTETLRGGDRPKNAEAEFDDVTVMPKSAWEPWLLFRRPCDGTVAQNLRHWGTGGLRREGDVPFRDVIVSSPTRPRERRVAPHPSLKPQSFMRRVVAASLPLGRGRVLDPFAGAGSTLGACEALGYRGVGVELDEEYAQIAVRAIPALAQLSRLSDLALPPQAPLPLQ